jgi:putative flippase GtrA
VRFSDAQCGFKAVRRAALDRLLPDVRDQGWFFDTELLVLAQRRGLRIHEVPVDWIDDPDSRVDLVRTALADLRGIARLALAAPLVRFLLVGVASTAANRRLIFGLRGRDGLVRQHVMGAAVFLLGLGLTSGALAVVHGLVAHPSRPVELAVLIAASVVATATRYAALRAWVFARRLRPHTTPTQ